MRGNFRLSSICCVLIIYLLLYYYDIEVISTEAFDRDSAKKLMRELLSKADKTSAEIDAAMINTTVSYTPPFNVNDSFEDAMEAFVANKDQA